jgi:hypothetical protein
MANNFKKVIDRQQWVQVQPSLNAHAVGMGMASDLRNNISRNPFAYQLTSNSIMNRFNIIMKSWKFAVNPGLGGTFGAGAGCVFAPSLSLVGNITTGSTTTSIVTSTTITNVGLNMLANRGASGEHGYKIRIIGKRAGGSGKIEERWIIGNTSGTTPTIQLDVPLSFTPTTGDTYEILSGRVFASGAGTTTTTTFRQYDVATNAVASLSNTGLPATIGTEYSAIALDEQYVPYNHIPGEGFIAGTTTYDPDDVCGVKRAIQATASSANSITSATTDVLANEYRNFQIRIVEDTVTPTAVGQRAIIASHTAGTSPVFTMGTNWLVTPSTSARFVIEYPNLLLLWTTALTTTHTYNYSTLAVNNGTTTINGGAWSTTYFGVRGSAMGAGCTSFGSFGIQPDVNKNSRHSFVYSFRGGNGVNLDVLDIAGGTTGAWSNAVVYDGSVSNFNTGSCGKYAPYDNEGRFAYINIYVSGNLNQIYRFDVKNRVLDSFAQPGFALSGTAASGDRIATYVAIDGNDRYTHVLLMNHTSTISQEITVLV